MQHGMLHTGYRETSQCYTELKHHQNHIPLYCKNKCKGVVHLRDITDMPPIIYTITSLPLHNRKLLQFAVLRIL